MSNTVAIYLLDREFKVNCPKDEIAELQKAATYLDNKMREISHNNKLATIDRVAITAALNIAHELNGLNECLLNLKNKLKTCS